RGGEALVGGDFPTVDRHVEVLADQHALAGQVEIGHSLDGHGSVAREEGGRGRGAGRWRGLGVGRPPLSGSGHGQANRHATSLLPRDRASPSGPCRSVRKEPFSCAPGEGPPFQLSPRGSGSALLLRSGRRWRAAPDEGTSAASCCCPSQARIKGTLRSARAPSSALRAPSPVNGRRASSVPCLVARVGTQPFSCAAGEGGAQRRMRARAQRAALALPGNIKSTLRCARAPSSALRAPSPVNGRRASFPSLAARSGSTLLLR